MRFPALLIFLAATGVSATVAADVLTRAERAELSDSYRQRTRDRVDRLPPELEFFGEEERYAWYRVRSGAEAAEWVLLDLEAGGREVLFDTHTLERAFAALDADVEPEDELQVGGLSFSADARMVDFQLNGVGCRWDRETGKLRFRNASAAETSSHAAGLQAMSVVRPSRGGEATTIEIRNQLERPLDVFWIDTRGRRQSYGRIAAGESFTQSTYAGHVWLLVDDEGEAVAAYRAARNQRLAVVDSATRVPRPRRRRRPDRERGEVPRWRSPDQRWQVRFVDSNVVLVDLERGGEYPLTATGRDGDAFGGRVWWSPNSQHFVVMRTDRGDRREVTLVEAAPQDQLQPRVDTYTYAKPGDELDHPRPYLFHVSEFATAADDTVTSDPAAIEEAARIRDGMFSSPYALNRLEWRQDSSGFTFLYNQRGHQVLRVIAVDAASGDPRVVIDEQAETFVCYSQKLFLERLEDSNEMIWMTERDGWNHLILVDWTTGRVKNRITRGDWVVREVERVDPASRQLWLTASGLDTSQDPYHRHLVRINFDGRELTRLTRGDGDHRWEYSPEGRWLIDTYSRVDLPPVTVVRDATTGEEVVTAERADWSRLLETGWRPPERFVAKGRDGRTDIHGIIVRPTHFDPQLRYPVLEAIYAGPHSSFTPKSFGLHNGLYEMAELGFIVVKLDGMGTSDRSKAFHDVCWQNLADSGFPDRKLWIRAAAEQRPEMDLGRVGIWGGSAGGQSALRALLSHGEFYHAAASDCGCHDNRMDKIWWNEQWMGWPIGDHYHEQSNVTDAHRLRGDLLLTVGALDRNVDPSSTMQVVEALIRADKDFELIVFPSGGHSSGSSRYGKRRMKDFFLRSLGDPQPR
jgi:dipeptidyl aminopeptidase/acylaminoacyl peptidase